MSKTCMTKGKGILNLKIHILLGVVALVFIAGMGTVAYAASGNNASRLTRDIGIFDPFSLQMMLAPAVTSMSQSTLSSVLLITRPIVRIPIRPIIRTPYRPPLVP
jgi:hypothetical protein